MILTLDMLKSSNLPRQHINVFLDLFGDQVELTEESLERMLEENLDIYTIAEGNRDVLAFLREHRNVFLLSPEWALDFSLYVNERKPDTAFRKAACGSPWTAFEYAYAIDKCPRDDTRKAALGLPKTAYLYAVKVDKCPRDDTREAAGRHETWKYLYSIWEKEYEGCSHQ